jgi:hypothetical protein
MELILVGHRRTPRRRATTAGCCARPDGAKLRRELEAVLCAELLALARKN